MIDYVKLRAAPFGAGRVLEVCGNENDMKDFIVYKRIKLRDYLRLPPGWDEIACSYTKFRRKAEKETPPGVCVLLTGIFQALLSKDTCFIDKAVKLVEGNVAEDYILRLTGAAFCTIGHGREGLERLRKAVTINPSAANMVALGDYLDSPGDYYEKLVLANRVLENNPNDLDALHHAAFVLVHNGRLEEAERYIMRMIDISPKNRPAREARAELFYRRGEYKSALQQYKRARKWSDTSKRLWQQIALCCYFLGNVRKAKKAALKMKKVEVKELNLQVDGAFADCILAEVDGRRRLGLEYLSSGFDSRAYPFLKIEAAREDKPGEGTLYFAALETVRTKNTKHIENAVRTIGDNMSRDILLSVSGRAKCEAGREEAGLAEMREAVELNPSIENLDNLAVCLSSRPESKAEARGLFKRVLSQAPDDAEALSYLGFLSDDPEEALEFYRRASEIEHENWQIHYDIGKALYSLGRFDQAVDEYQRARCLVDENPARISIGIARCYLAMEKYKEAFENAKRALVEDPASDEAKELFAEVELAMGDADPK